MNAIHQLLGDNEELLAQARQHWCFPLIHLVADLVLLVLLNMAGWIVPLAFPELSHELVYFSVATLSISVGVSAIAEVLRWRRSRVLITDRRVVRIQGVLPSVDDVSLEAIVEPRLHRTPLGRLLDFADIELVTAAAPGTLQLASIEHPQRLITALERARQRYQAYFDTRAVGSYTAPRDISALLEQLAALRDRGILSAAEFEAQKRELLSRI